jgi:hypothetical protein
MIKHGIRVNFLGMGSIKYPIHGQDLFKEIQQPQRCHVPHLLKNNKIYFYIFIFFKKEILFIYLFWYIWSLGVALATHIGRLGTSRFQPPSGQTVALGVVHLPPRAISKNIYNDIFLFF